MRTMPNIKLTTKELDLIIEDGRFNWGGEAVICRNNNPHTLYKIFTEPGTEDPIVMPENKCKKILRLYNEPLENSVQPISTISNKGEIIGYEISFDEDDESIFDSILTEEEQLHYLRVSANILLYYASKDITYGDVKSDNLLINKKTGKAKFCDIDNIRVGDLPIDVMGHGLTEYYDEVLSIDEKADAYMHNLFFLEQLKYRNLAYNRILENLSINPLMPSLIDYPTKVRRIIKSLTIPASFEGEYAIQYIKK